MAYLTALVYVLVLGSAVRLLTGLHRARSSAAAPGESARDVLEAAFLAGGPGRVADTVVVAMHLDGRLAVAEPGLLGVRRAEVRHPVEQSVLDAHALAPSGALHWVRTGVMRGPQVQALGDGLAARGLLVPPGALRPLRRWALVHTVGCLLGFPLAVLLTVVQYVRLDADSPVPFVLTVLPALVFGTVLGFVSLLRARGSLTTTGRRALRAFAASGAPAVDLVALVAVRGPSALPDPALRAILLRALRERVRPAALSGSAQGAAYGTPLVVAGEVNWCGGGGSSCGGSSCGGSSCSGASGGSCGGGSGSSCGGSSCGSSGSSCGGGGGGGGCGGGSS
ncbi:TIGR04222 domain-containing membrane protein [Streptomyces sp. SCSIO ZS0520]|uniref:TIGR04222 domain-containing membrane protein n=1 Tax=Streptomyces sp. SCSIO ZS0520 TaxID=2892996 RepID=UPI0021DAD2BE|nr:TIGR04222 domain-containing membrane protein [Streptomyces sp. SCSIO ZS0520]